MIVNTAAIHAGEQDIKVTRKHILDAWAEELYGSETENKNNKKRTAIHEAGHCIVSWTHYKDGPFKECPPSYLTVRNRIGVNGFSSVSGSESWDTSVEEYKARI